ncbi:MAG: exodeoxyribonuclease VII small subunit [Candidatus Nomurabacteria bacterium]|jgi:exodeoxyribonuclease VII small subunit|nr:exodeoxyribonuclease VII small subunit [Candidatus Nomurabacteria bacterium]
MSDKTIKQNLDKFEEIVAWFNSDDIDIEKSVAKYEAGAKLAAEIEQQLASQKNRIKVLSQKFDD